MYPDTDSPPTPILEKYLADIRKNLPERLWDTEKRLKKLGLIEPLIKSLSISKYLKIFIKIVEELDINPILVAVTFEEKLKCMRRKGKNVELISEKKLYQVFKFLSEKKYSKEAITMILEFLADNPKKDVKNAIEELGIKPMSPKELDVEINKILKQYSSLKKNRPLKTIMGEVMKTVRNRIDGKIVKEALEKKYN